MKKYKTRYAEMLRKKSCEEIERKFSLFLEGLPKAPTDYFRLQIAFNFPNNWILENFFH